MSGRYAKRTCGCGRAIYSNSGTHQRACNVALSTSGWPLGEQLREAVREDVRLRRITARIREDVRPLYGADVIPEVERRLGLLILDRRQRGDKSTPPWRELRPLVYGLVDDVVATFTKLN